MTERYDFNEIKRLLPVVIERGENSSEGAQLTKETNKYIKFLLLKEYPLQKDLIDEILSKSLEKSNKFLQKEHASDPEVLTKDYLSYCKRITINKMQDAFRHEGTKKSKVLKDAINIDDLSLQSSVAPDSFNYNMEGYFEELSSHFLHYYEKNQSHGGILMTDSLRYKVKTFVIEFFHTGFQYPKGFKSYMIKNNNFSENEYINIMKRWGKFRKDFPESDNGQTLKSLLK